MKQHRRGWKRPLASLAGLTAAVLAGAYAVPTASTLLAGATEASSPSPATTAPYPHMNHVFVIMMENTSYKYLLDPAQPATSYIRYLATHYGLANHYYGVTHTSLPNYIAATSGSNWDSQTDDPAQAPYFNHENLVDQFQAAHVSWKAYMQSLPYAGDTADYASYTAKPASPSNALYVRKHDPFLMYPDVYQDPARASHVVPLGQLATDLRTGNVPQFSWISPNVCNDMHGMSGTACTYGSSPTSATETALLRNGDQFIQHWVTAIMASKAWTGNSTIFITWDEGTYAFEAPYGPTDLRAAGDSPLLPNPPVNPATAGGGDLVGSTVYGGGHVPMIVVSREGAQGGAVDPTPTNHYSLLRTIEANFGLPYLENAGDSVQVKSLAPLLKR